MTRTPTKKKRSAPAPPGRPLWLRVILWLLVLGMAAGALGSSSLLGMFYYYGRDSSLPRITSVRDYQPPVVTRIFDRRGVLIGEISAERRTVVPYTRIPQLMVQAVIASEDADFFKHRGLDYTGMLRAFFVNLRAGHFAQGGSTITQQVVKTFFLSPDRTIRRKMQEVILAQRLESELAKEEILHLYLNQIYFAHGRYGVEEASRFYFGKGVDKLGLAEIALLAGLPQSPERLSPFKHPAAAKRRQQYVLREMKKQGFISEQERQAVSDAPIQVVRNTRPHYNIAPEFTDQVRAELLQTFGAERLTKLGLQVNTTLDVKLQQAAREAVKWGLEAIDARQGYRRRLAHLPAKRQVQVLQRLKRAQQTFSEGKHYQALVLQVDDAAQELTVDLGSRQGKVTLLEGDRYNPQRHAPSKRFKPGDLIWVRYDDASFYFDAGPQAALVALDPETGEVLAMVGGYDFEPGNYNRATQAVRQPGSAFKPFTFAAALESGKFTAATVVEDEQVVFNDWEPKNYDKGYLGPVRLRQALAHSINTVAAKLIHQVGVEPVRKLATALGISTALGKDLSLTLGTSEVKVIEMAATYSAFANGGKAVTPHYISRVGKQALKQPEAKQVLSPEVAYIMRSMLQSVIEEGTARQARRLRQTAGGKTGTTNGLKDAWFVGFSPQLSVAVWVGFDDPSSLGRGETGGRAALPIWLRFMQKALKDTPRQRITPPPGVVVRRIDALSGLLAPEGGTQVLDELFVLGTEPTEVALPPNPNIPIDPYPALDPTDPNLLVPAAGTAQAQPEAATEKASAAPSGGARDNAPDRRVAPIEPLGHIPVAPSIP